MSRHRKDLKSKIASLSALGAGALIVGAGGADASTIYSGPVNVDVGASGVSQFGITLGGLNTLLSFKFGAGTTSVLRTNRLHYRFIRGFGHKSAAVLIASTGLGGHDLSTFLPGSVFTGAAGSNVLVGSRRWRTSVDGGHRNSVVGNVPFSHEYALFKFTSAAGQTDYGWIQLSYSVTNSFGTNPALGPDLTIIDYAWDNSGAKLPAGATSIPEPGTMGLTGLGALALGAVGLRRWRKNRSAA